MIINTPRNVHSNLLEYSLGRIRAYKNSDYIFHKLVELHKLPQKHHKSARSVADQIRACIINAQEHFSAASVASNATKSLHLYYGLMNYALAISVYKGGGDYRLDKLRELHASHGLTPSININCDPRLEFKALVQGMRAKPMCRPSADGSGPSPYGTFEVWRRHHREFPGATRLRKTSATGWYTVECVGKFGGKDEAPKPLPANGIDLEEALLAIPALTTRLASMDIASNLVGAALLMYQPEGRDGTLQVVLQPQPQFPKVVSDFRKLVKYDAVAANHINVEESNLGTYAYSITLDGPLIVRGEFELPPIVYSTSLVTQFSTNGWDLGEFGAYYVTLFLLGNIVRYYPDLWISHVENDTEFAQIIELVCDSAVERISVLVASELDREQIVAFEYDPGIV